MGPSKSVIKRNKRNKVWSATYILIIKIAKEILIKIHAHMVGGQKETNEKKNQYLVLLTTPSQVIQVSASPTNPLKT